MALRTLCDTWRKFLDENETKDKYFTVLIALSSCALSVAGIFAALSETQQLISENLNGLQHKASYIEMSTLEQIYVVWVDGIKFQVLIAIGLAIRFLAVWTYKQLNLTPTRRFLGIVISQLSFGFTLFIWSWYCVFSYKFLTSTTAFNRIGHLPQSYVGIPKFWGVILSIVILTNLLVEAIRILAPLYQLLLHLPRK